jgi:hypothetical protein
MPWIHDDFLEWQRLRAGPLGPQLDTFAETLTAKGYAPATVALKVRMAAKFGHWLGRRGLAIGDLGEQSVAGFVQHHRCTVRRGDVATLRELLEHVRSAGLAPPAPAKVDDTTIGRTLSEFDRSSGSRSALARPSSSVGRGHLASLVPGGDRCGAASAGTVDLPRARSRQRQLLVPDRSAGVDESGNVAPGAK